MFSLLSLIFRNVLRNRRRSILTLASTAISLAILTTMVAVYQGFFYGPDVSEAGALRLITRHRVALVQPLPISYLDWLKTVPGVDRGLVSSYTWFQGKYNDNKEQADFFARLGVDASTIFGIY